MSTDAVTPPTPRRVTAADVARRSGVSRATVSYVLNKVADQTIPRATQDRVRAAAQELGYIPVAAAASLRRGHSRIILVVTEPALSGAVTEPFLMAIAERLAERGFTPVTHQLVSEESLIGLTQEVRPYGVLALVALSADALAQISAAAVPRLYSSAQGDPSFPRPWEEEIGAMQARHLLQSGCTALAYAAPLPTNPRAVMARSRRLGVATVCADSGIPAPRDLILPPDLDAATNALRALLPLVGRLGICAFDDSVGAIALAAARELGLTVPEELAVIGVDDAPFSPFLAPPLTTLAIDGRSTGLALAERFLQDDELRDRSHAAARLVERASV